MSEPERDLHREQMTADIGRTRAMVRQNDAEADRAAALAAKLRSDTRMYPDVVIGGLLGAAAAVGKLLATLACETGRLR